MTNENSESWKESAVAAIGIGAITIAAMIGMLSIHERYRGRTIPSEEQVQAGYVAPSKLEVTLKDLDNNGEQETIVNVEGKPYALMYDANGKPQLREYEIKINEGN